jgi:hypothetical protein
LTHIAQNQKNMKLRSMEKVKIINNEMNRRRFLGYPCFTLKDEKGGIVSALTDCSFNVKSLPVAPPDKATSVPLTSTFLIAPAYTDSKGTFSRACKPGTYDLFISVGKMDGTPLYELPYEGDDGRKRYPVGKITIE